MYTYFLFFLPFFIFLLFLLFYYYFILFFWAGWARPSQPGPVTGPSQWPGWAKATRVWQATRVAALCKWIKIHLHSMLLISWNRTKGRGSGLPWLAEGDEDNDKVETERKAEEAAYLGWPKATKTMTKLLLCDWTTLGRAPFSPFLAFFSLWFVFPLLLVI